MNEPTLYPSPQAPAGTRTITIKGQRLQVAIRPGDGTRTLLLLMNGIGANLELLQPFVDALDPAIEVIRFDVPGVGGSPAPRLPYRFSGLARLVARMLDQLGYDRVDVLGISWGGGLAQQFAVQYPRRCRRLVLVSTSTGALMVSARPDVLAKLVTPRRYFDQSYLESIGLDLYGGSTRSNPELVRELAQGMHGISRRGYFYQLLAGLGWTSVLWLHLVRQPTLILSGDDDPIIPLANAKILHALIPNARLHIFHGGHLGLVTETDQLAPVVAQFLAEEAQQVDAGTAPGRLQRIGRAIRQRLKQVLTHVRQRRLIMLNLAILLEDSAREEPQREAIVCNDTRLSYAALNAAANQVANLLARRGIGKGDKVVLSCLNVPYFPIVYYGILKAGAVVVPINVLNKPREVAYYLQDSEARAYFCFEGTPQLPMGENGYAGFQLAPSCEHFFLMTADPAAPSPIAGATTLGTALREMPAAFETALTDLDDTAVILYTSGTTGQPKGAELTHANMLLNARLADTLYPRVEHDVHLISLPLFHSFGQTAQMNAGIYNRATLVLLPRFSADGALSLMDRENVTFFAGVPTVYWELLNYTDADKYDLLKIARNLRICMSGGAAMPIEVMRAFEERYDVTILEGYGLSETSPIATFNRTDRSTKPGSIGLPVWGVTVRVVDKGGGDVPIGEPGEIAIGGHNIMKGYYKRPEATAEAIKDGWFRTGDIGRRDEDGYFYIVDRTKDMIVRGGFNVYPREIEEVLMTHPAVSLAAVVGVPHASHGEEVKAFIIRKEGAVVSETELIAWCKENMAAYKYPRIVEFRESFPMTSTGKLLKRELR